MRHRIGTVIAATCLLGACMLLLPTAAHAQETISSKFLEQTIRESLAPVAMAFMTKVSDFMTPVLASLATIFVLWTALKNFLADRAFPETFAEILMTLLIISALTNTANYKWLFWDTLYGGLYTELVVPAGEGETGFPEALSKLGQRQAERAAQQNLSIASQLANWAASANQARDSFGVTWMMSIVTMFTEPLILMSIVLALASITFYGGIGQIFLSMWMFDFTKDYTKKWFGCFMGAIFSLVAISFFVPFFENWDSVAAAAVALEAADQPGLVDKLLYPSAMKQFVVSITGIMMVLKAPSIGKELFR